MVDTLGWYLPSLGGDRWGAISVGGDQQSHIAEGHVGLTPISHYMLGVHALWSHYHPFIVRIQHLAGWSS